MNVRLSGFAVPNRVLQVLVFLALFYLNRFKNQLNQLNRLIIKKRETFCHLELVSFDVLLLLGQSDAQRGTDESISN